MKNLNSDSEYCAGWSTVQTILVQAYRSILYAARVPLLLAARPSAPELVKERRSGASPRALRAKPREIVTADFTVHENPESQLRSFVCNGRKVERPRGKSIFYLGITGAAQTGSALGDSDGGIPRALMTRAEDN